MTAKSKICKSKRNNQKRNKLLKQGVIKSKKLKPKRVQEAPKVVRNEEIEESESDNGEDMLQMVEEDDLNFLKNAISNRSYNIYNKVRCTKTTNRSKKRKLESDDEELENDYEDNRQTEVPVKSLLPIKVKDRIILQTAINEIEDEEQIDETIEGNTEKEVEEDDEDSGTEYTFDENLEFDPSQPIGTAELLVTRNRKLQEKKLHIGTLSSGLLENPEEKLTNFKTLLELLNDKAPELYLTLRKLVIVSLLEVFKDLLPSYQIKAQEKVDVKLKKDTLKLQKFEEGILQYYKKYLQKLEKYGSILFKKRGDSRKRTEEELKLGELSIHAMCDLLVTHPYFNYAENIAQVVVPFINNKNKNVRQIVGAACKTVFKEDKKEQITLKILQILNQYLRKQAHNVNPEMLEILLSLRIKDVNLDQEKENDMKEKKLMSHKQNVLQLSKKERKRKKRLKQLETELLETKAEENKQHKLHNLTEITKIVFGIYFRILKSSTNTKVLGVCLEGLAKFSHCINLEYFVDLVNVLDRLLKEDWLGYREKLHCIQTVFVILSGVGEALNIDPTRFYVTLYKDLLVTHAAKNHENCGIVLNTLSDALIKRRKKITNKRIIGFVKRMATLSLQLLHNSSLSCLGIVKVLLQLSKAVDVLLDLDTSVGDGKYQPELDDAEYSNASSTALFEVVPLSRHYHPIVSKYAKHIASGAPATGNGSLPPQFGKCTPEQLLADYDMAKMTFNPPIPIPRKVQPRIRPMKHVEFADQQFKTKCFEVVKQSRKSQTFFYIDC